MEIIQRRHVETLGLLARARELRKQLRKVVTKHVDRRRVILDADLGLEGKELPDSGNDGGRGMHEGIALKGRPRDGALFGAETLPSAEFAERRVAVPQPVVGVVRQGGFEVTQAQRGVRAALAEIRAMMPSSISRPNRKLLPPGVKAKLPVMARFEIGQSATPVAMLPAANHSRGFGSASGLNGASSQSAAITATHMPAAAMWLGMVKTITAARMKRSHRASRSLQKLSR